MREIEPLSSTTRAQIRSTQILTSLPQIVSELLQNSLDARASNIEIGIDSEEWSCWVKDDGQGISKESLMLLGNSENGSSRYGSSKAYTPDSLDFLTTFGFRGEALASAADLCSLEICSRTQRSRDTWSIIVKGGKTLYSGRAVRWRREKSGTVVCIRDAFYNLPVRRLSHPTPSRTMELIKQEIQAYALVFADVSFSLESTQNVGTSLSAKEAIMKVPKTSTTLKTFGHLFGRAMIKDVDNIDLVSGDMKLSGFISLSGAHTKAYQYLYVNRHPLAFGDLHSVIDSRFAASSFAKHASGENGDMELPRSAARRSPRKAEKRPVYVLNLTIPPHQVDNCLEPSKAIVHLQNKTAVESFLSTAVKEFLSRHGFNSVMSSRRQELPKKRRKLDDDVDFEGDSGYAEVFSDSHHFQSPRKDGPLFIRQQDDDLDDGQVLWEDPNTGESFMVDTRTGNSRPQGDPLKTDETAQIALRRTLPQSVKAVPGATMPEWIRDALKANDTYDTAQGQIPAVILPQPEIHDPQHDCRQGTDRRQQRLREQQFLSKQEISDRFGKSDLSNCSVISQVDKKFIACLVQRPTIPPSLILIDQHAADERVRVERFLKQICFGFLHNSERASCNQSSVELRDLSPPIPILLTKPEVIRLAVSKEVRRAFWNWGFCFSDLSGAAEHIGDEIGDNESGYFQVSVEKIPEVVGDKLLQGDELRDLVKGFLARLETDTPLNPKNHGMGSEENGNASEFVWLKALRWCPKELLDLINSKACRGAIMFNDPLNREQCERLVSQLTQTAFPFQCAHGRPSLVPLTNLGRLSPRTDSNRRVFWSRLED
ncbi:hypothetical protein C8J56DRAFT_989423 [Mycena floridula]|nr:hypothetical protein C8J56DRAFT_989423 [Mycena floridula]